LIKQGECLLRYGVHGTGKSTWLEMVGGARGLTSRRIIAYDSDVLDET
jgi:ABC-type lipoprotein export system ATPase subunit